MNQFEIKDGLIRYIVLEILYTCFVVGWLYFVQGLYGSALPMDAVVFKCIVLSVVGMIWVIGPWLNRLPVLLVVSVFDAYYIGQIAYNKAFHTWFRMNTALDLFREVVGVPESAAEFLSRQEMYVLIAPIVFTVISIVIYFLLQRREVKWKPRLILAVSALVVVFPIHDEIHNYSAYVDSLSEEQDAFFGTSSEKDLYDRMSNSLAFVEKFGLLPFAVQDINVTFVQKEAYEEQTAEVTAFLEQLPEQYKSEYNGLFAGKNVLFVQAESYNHFACDPDLTPTFYKMFQEGLVIDGFDTPALAGSTSDSEFMANTSLIPDSDGHAVCHTADENTFVTTLPKLFNEAGYDTAAYHNNYGNYYNRDVMFPHLGYDQFFSCTELGMMDANSDSEVMEKMKWIFVEADKPWMAYWITYSGHQPYNLESCGVSEEDVEKIRAKYPELSDTLVSYWAKNMDLDRSLKNLMDKLEEVGKLEDTVFVFYGDHIAKGIDFNTDESYKEATGIPVFESTMYTELVFYCSALNEPIHVQKTATLLDLLPTVADLWDLDYDAHTVLGRNIFDPDYEGFFFSNWMNWRTDWCEHKNMSDEYKVDDEHTEEQAIEAMNYYEEEVRVSGLILKQDYFKEEE